MAAKNSEERVKDILLEHVLQDIKRLQNAQSDLTLMEDTVTLANIHVQALCEHMDRILLHGLKFAEFGYWPLVKYFTRTDAVQLIGGFAFIKTSLGRGRAWLYMALNEQSMESYVRMFLENQDQVNDFYVKEAFLKDCERLVVLQTLVAGLDYISFDLPIESFYFDYGATRESSTVGSLQFNELIRDVEPSFISSTAASSDTKNPSSDSRERSVSSPAAAAVPKSSQEPGLLQTSETTGQSRLRSSSTKADSISRDKAQSEAGANVFTFREQSKAAGDSRGIVSSGEFHSGSGVGSPGLGVVNESEDSIQSSLSPHRSLSQAEAAAAASEQSKSSRRFTELEQTAEREDGLVQRPKKSKSKKKKDKKKKRRDSDGLTQSLPTSSVSSQPKDEISGTGTGRAEAELKKLGLTQSKAKAESYDMILRKSWDMEATEDSQSGQVSEEHGKDNSKTQATESKPRSRRTSLENEQTGKGKDTKEEENKQEWRPAAEVLAEEEEKKKTELETLLETSPSRVLHNKRLSLADELEEALGKEMNNEPLNLDPTGDHVIPGDLEVGGFGDSGSKTSPLHSYSSLPLAEDSEEVTGWKDREEEEPEVTKEEVKEEEDEEKFEELHVNDESEPPYLGMDDSNKTEEVVAEITKEDREANDLPIDDNTQLVVSLDVLFNEGDKEEEILRLVQLATPTVAGQQRTCYLLLTTHAVYIMRRDGIEGQFSRDVGIKFRDFHHIVAGLGWQSLVLVYSSGGNERKYILLTGSEAVSQSVAKSIRKAANAASNYTHSIALTKTNQEKVEAIENELIKLGSETSMDLELYLMVNWEQLKGKSTTLSSSGGHMYAGPLQVKTTNLIGITSWKQSHFVLRDGFLFQYSSEDDDVAKGEYKIRHCGGCQRVSNEGKQYAFSVMGSDGSVMLVLAATSEEDMTKWSQMIIETAVMSPTHRTTCFSCALLLTQNMIHILQEDWSDQSVQLVASCKVTDVNDISVDKSLPLYCTISYDQETEQGVWLVCFNTQYELAKFEQALGKMWREEFQINLQFSEVNDMTTCERAHKAVELMQGSRFRCDSVTRGRTEFTYSDKY